jgi:hypothetical protein
MTREEQRKQLRLQEIVEWLEAKSGEKIDLNSLSADLRKQIDQLASKDTEEPQKRMRGTMAEAAKAIGLRWSEDHPADHPYGAELDGQIFNGKTRIAVVELEAKNAKQVRGALLDLVLHPERKKILLLGRSVVCDPSEVETNIRQVLSLLSPLMDGSRVAIFTEDDLKNNPAKLADFLSGLNDGQG